MIYLNWAATAPRLSRRTADGLTEFLGGGDALPAGRSFEGLEDAGLALRARMALGELFGAKKPGQVIFTSGVTAALNMLIHGVVRCGGHVIATSVEHNAAARPLADLEARGVCSVTWLPCAPDGTLDPALVRAHLRPDTRLLVMTHASNVLGTVLPTDECFKIAKEHGVFTLLDAAQTAGHLPVQLGGYTDALAFTGHKGLGGLAGVGGFVLAPEAAGRVEPWLTGGTGSASHLLTMPGFLPDRFEPGTPNTIGILSLALAAEELLEIGMEKIAARERALTARFLDAAGSLPVTLYGTRDPGRTVPVVSLSIPGMDCGDAARRLYDDHGIVTRSGLHCSPLAHRTMGTYPEGTVRFSFGKDTTSDEIDAAAEALSRLAAGQ